MSEKGLLVIFSGPAGSGKDTVLDETIRRGSDITISVSMTTRLPRKGEIDGLHYYFVSEEYFKEQIKSGKMLEYAKYGINYYGTPKAPVDKWLSEGKTVVLKIEVQGAEKIRKIYPEAIGVFIMPPDLDTLEKRLRSRGSEDENDIIRRLNIAKSELEQRKFYDYVIVNDRLDDAVDEFNNILKIKTKL